MDAKKTLIGLTLTVIFVFALGAIAMATDLALYAGGWQQPVYVDQAELDATVEKIINNTGQWFNDVQTFDDDHLVEFGEWADANTGDGELDIIWFNGWVPSPLYKQVNLEPDGSRAEEWLDNGNMFINVGDWFAFATWENGFKEANAGTGAANILDLPEDFIVGGGGQLKVTPTGKKFMPSLGDTAGSDRYVNLNAIDDPWEVAAIFASVGGSDDPAAETKVDPVVIHNKDTDGYLAIINQGWAGNAEDRGAACADFINNWVGEEMEMLSVEPAGKLSTTWGKIKHE